MISWVGIIGWVGGVPLPFYRHFIPCLVEPYNSIGAPFILFPIGE
jgi:hypothetical protein